MSSQEKQLPDQFATFVSFLSEQSRMSPELVREVFANVYRQGYADGRLDGTQAALDAAEKALGEAAQ